MTDLYQPTTELVELIAALLDDEIDSASRTRLTEILHADLAAREFYYDQVEIQSFLAWEMHRPRDVDDANAFATDLPRVARSPILGFLANSTHQATTFITKPTPLSLGIAILVVGSIVASLAMIYPRTPNDPAVRSEIAYSIVEVATLSELNRVTWGEDASRPPGVRPRLRVGQWLKVATGDLLVKYDTGAHVVLQGPADYRVIGSNGGFLQFGKLLAKLKTKSAQGFVVDTPAGKVTDLGTEFGVMVRGNSDARIDVFKGLVVVETHDRSGTLTGSRTRLAAGNALTINARTGNIVTIPATRSRIAQHGISDVTTVRLQNGVDGYAGQHQRRMRDDGQANPTNSLKVGDNGNDVDNRFLIRFDLSSLAGKTVATDGLLRLTIGEVSGRQAPEISDVFDVYLVHDTNAGWQRCDPSWNLFSELSRPWRDGLGNDLPLGAVNAKAPTLGGLGTPGQGYAATPLDSIRQRSYATGETVAITIPKATLQRWIDDTNGGMLFRKRDEENFGRLVFQGSGEGDDVGLRPVLTFGIGTSQ